MKLKKLVLSGFKSFADRTEFDFDDGISCIVGPNGCGKSNIVDAVKWVLGEQSAKSLRGSEMADVIFNGSAGRRPSGKAEVTLIFDDAGGLLQPSIDGAGSADGMVSITRRLFRNGQSQYLINKIPCRLKDIREMFMDTGVGVDAYSVIEQGRVEMFLQASQEDRRSIFDEAAGISKYKARKTEALRKLERVEQNLLRLNDILAEVDKRLRSIKYQAGKARNYQIYTERLKGLRSLYFLGKYHELSCGRSRLQRELDARNDRLAGINARIDQLEATASVTEVEAVDLERIARELQGRIVVVDASITTHRERAEMQSARTKELGEQAAAACARCEKLEAEFEAFERDFVARSSELERLESRSGELTEQYQAVWNEQNSGELAISRLQDRLEDEKTGTIDLLRRTSQLHNEIHALGIRHDNLTSRKARLSGRAEEIGRALRDMLTERAEVQAKLRGVQEVLSASRTRLDQTEQTSQQLAEAERGLQAELSAARERRSAVLSRMDVLRQMHAKLEGIGAGTRRVMEARREGRLQGIRGMLGDFVQTDVQHATVAEAALAGADQQLLVDKFEDAIAIAGELSELLGQSGTAEVLCLDRLKTLQADSDISIRPPDGLAGADRQVIAPVIDWVRFDAWLEPVMKLLLGRAFVVRTLADAAAAAEASPPGLRFVTLNGDVLEPDGRIKLRAANRTAGLITRRSELKELDTQKVELDVQIVELGHRCQTSDNERGCLAELQQGLRTAIYEANTERLENESRIARLDERIGEFQREEPVVAGDLENLSAEIDATAHSEHEARQKASELERLNGEQEEQIEQLGVQIVAARQRYQELLAKAMELKVAGAQAAEKLRATKESLAALGRRREHMELDLAAGRSGIELTRQRRAEAEAAAADAHAEAERLCAQQETLNHEEKEIEQTRCGLQEKLDQIRQQLTDRRKVREQISEELNASRVELGEVDVRIESLIVRADEQMHMNLLECYASYQHEEQRDWDAVAAEIEELSGKIERLGNVNLDALVEQDELQQRHEFLAAQLADVRASQDKLAELVRRINKESRRLFLETFEAIRANFHELFRKLFGGGRADIFLADDDNVLESGIEIVARPPGKELRSLSLLSGGEKAMTALALLFSIFKSRPSPFCLLDEVDAALDEANNERFNRLLNEFVPSSQFIIISHAKRTLSIANVLYGVTMAEPGVSKRISVRFEGAGGKEPRRLEDAVV